MTQAGNLQQLSRMALGAVVLAMAGITASCSGTSDTAPESSSSDSDQADPGAAVYASSCASCHGDELQGSDKGPPQLSVVYEPNHHPDGSYESAILNGAPQHHWNFGDMPPIEGLSDEDITAVIAYIRSEQERIGFQPYPPE